MAKKMVKNQNTPVKKESSSGTLLPYVEYSADDNDDALHGIILYSYNNNTGKTITTTLISNKELKKFLAESGKKTFNTIDLNHFIRQLTDTHELDNVQVVVSSCQGFQNTSIYASIPEFRKYYSRPNLSMTDMFIWPEDVEQDKTLHGMVVPLTDSQPFGTVIGVPYGVSDESVPVLTLKDGIKKFKMFMSQVDWLRLTETFKVPHVEGNFWRQSIEDQYLYLLHFMSSEFCERNLQRMPRWFEKKETDSYDDIVKLYRTTKPNDYDWNKLKIPNPNLPKFGPKGGGIKEEFTLEKLETYFNKKIPLDKDIKHFLSKDFLSVISIIKKINDQFDMIFTMKEDSFSNKDKKLYLIYVFTYFVEHVFPTIEDKYDTYFNEIETIKKKIEKINAKIYYTIDKTTYFIDFNSNDTALITLLEKCNKGENIDLSDYEKIITNVWAKYIFLNDVSLTENNDFILNEMNRIDNLQGEALKLVSKKKNLQMIDEDESFDKEFDEDEDDTNIFFKDSLRLKLQHYKKNIAENADTYINSIRENYDIYTLNIELYMKYFEIINEQLNDFKSNISQINQILTFTRKYIYSNFDKLSKSLPEVNRDSIDQILIKNFNYEQHLMYDEHFEKVLRTLETHEINDKNLLYYIRVNDKNKIKNFMIDFESEYDNLQDYYIKKILYLELNKI
jgi:hypothetical protein